MKLLIDFPQLTKDEKDKLVANYDQFKSLKHSTALPSVFTEHEVIMAANVINTQQAVDVSVFVINVFMENRFLRKQIQQEVQNSF
jgi:hypothetical protein